jgi:hypothetical protein
MAPTTTTATNFTFSLSGEEKSFLLNLLEEALKEKEIEVHRTEAFEFKERVGRQAALLEGLVERLRRL